MFYKHWKASGDNEWMKATLESAARALDYCVTDSIRWSKRFQLLKRPYCIDSWDFQVNDEYTPYAPISPTMVVVPGKTRYGIFFGDNTGYHEDDRSANWDTEDGLIWIAKSVNKDEVMGYINTNMSKWKP